MFPAGGKRNKKKKKQQQPQNAHALPGPLLSIRKRRRGACWVEGGVAHLEEARNDTGWCRSVNGELFKGEQQEGELTRRRRRVGGCSYSSVQEQIAGSHRPGLLPGGPSWEENGGRGGVLGD